jgi:leucyl/phenylalanyl-tRNA--protein transferase
MPVFLLSDDIVFPPPHLASKEGLLAVGGDLNQKRLLLAYQMGIFPWFSSNEPVMWWSPDPRLVLFPQAIRISRTLKKTLKKQMFRVTMDAAFVQVINMCAQVKRHNDQGTWIVDEMIEAYCQLHELGFAHSVEAWHQGELAGGLYGVSLGGVFFGESMFTLVSNASNVALVRLAKYLASRAFDMIDCQITTQHLLRFGAREIPRVRFLAMLERSLKKPTLQGRWKLS